MVFGKILPKTMGEYTVSYHSFDETKNCGECKNEYPVGYEFMCLKCGCGCASQFEICLICSPMYMQCDCGCKGSYAECQQRPTSGNLTVNFNFLYIFFLYIFLIKKYSVYLLGVDRIEETLHSETVFKEIIKNWRGIIG